MLGVMDAASTRGGIDEAGAGPAGFAGSDEGSVECRSFSGRGWDGHEWIVARLDSPEVALLPGLAACRARFGKAA
jgi:hypothetical protein